MPKYEVLFATRVLHKEGYKSVIRQFCDVIWKDGGVVRGISTLGTRQFPHYQDIRTESGIEKIWKGTIFAVDAMLKESTVSKLSEFAEINNDSISCKLAANPITYPLWCNYRENQNEKVSAYSDNVRNFDVILGDELNPVSGEES